jgi:hypothetical protein
MTRAGRRDSDAKAGSSRLREGGVNGRRIGFCHDVVTGRETR